ncbi:hypothetical protein [Burkholderia sp. Ac-20349]|uniref:hypothetical protein n=1 Tax=Burkholderia sp. Ac-20349 TaxID=2703893 RepID=UPI00197C01C4|nr:hypothetical protein [Burkholderia sp. Ac-20349]MBN3842109.1 hypothetical protein [Burkholderia sp. Ac-20349]
MTPCAGAARVVALAIVALALAAPGAAQARKRQCIKYLTVKVPDRIVSDDAMVHVFDRDGKHLASGRLYPDGVAYVCLRELPPGAQVFVDQSPPRPAPIYRGGS